MFWVVSEFLFFGFVGITVLTQILIPVFRDRPIFPIFRKRLLLESLMADANEQEHVDLLARELVEKVNKRAARQKNETQQNKQTNKKRK